MGTRLVTRWGTQVEDPTEEDLRAALAELAAPDPEPPDAWLRDADEYTLAAFASGLVLFGNAETGEERALAAPAPPPEVLRRWRLLQQGDLAALRREPPGVPRLP